MDHFNSPRTSLPPLPPGEGRGEGSITDRPMTPAELARIRAAEGQHPGPETDPVTWPPAYDKATVRWALACLTVLLAIVICGVAQSPGGLQ